ncbi:transposase, partial [Sphingobium yanoikuyae]|uniref:transposase n=1 Tax=Sphingobium yanoikuyae TaxID=13690 RepID=UPI000A90AAA1
KAQSLLGDRGYDTDRFRNAVQEKGIAPCPARKSRNKAVKYGTRRYKMNPNRLEIMFGRSKDWWRVPTRYDRCPNVFRSVVVLTAPSCSGYGPVPDEMISA